MSTTSGANKAEHYCLNHDVIRYLSTVAGRVAARSPMSFEDLFQEGMCKMAEMHDSDMRLAMKHAAYAIRALGASENRRRLSRADCYALRQSRRASCTFDALPELLGSLDQDDRKLFADWLTGSSLSAIGSKHSVTHGVVKRAIERCAAAICDAVGGDFEPSALWPRVAGGLPHGIRFRRGRYIAYAGHGGQKYLGSFATLDEAQAARIGR